MDLTAICAIVLVGIVALLGCIVPFIKVDGNYNSEDDEDFIEDTEEDEDNG